MSAFFTWQHAIIKSKLEPTTKLVCLTIGCHMAADGSGCFPSYATIAEESGLHRATVINHVQKAKEAGYLNVDGRERANGSDTSNLYRPTMPDGVAVADRGSRAGRPHGVAQDDRRKLNTPPEQITESPPNPQGGERDLYPPSDGFRAVCEAYRKASPSRVDEDAAWRVWREKCSDTDVPGIIAATGALFKTPGWQKEDGRYVPKLSKLLREGGWKGVAVVNGPTEAERRATSAARQKAFDDAIKADRKARGLYV